MTNFGLQLTGVYRILYLILPAKCFPAKTFKVYAGLPSIPATILASGRTAVKFTLLLLVDLQLQDDSMPRKTLPRTASLRAAKAAHDKFLRKMGIDPDRKPTRIQTAPDPLTADRHKTKQVLPPLSDSVGNGFKRKPSAKCDLPIAQVYHKGPIMVVTDMSSLEGSKRRG